MADARLVWDPANARADLALIGSVLDTSQDLETAILISLFTDHVAEPGDVLPTSVGAIDPRGWWADIYTAPDLIGSKLWQVMNRVTSQDTLNFARDTAEKSLQWLVDDGVASAVSVTASFYGHGGLRLDIAVTAPASKVYGYLWADVLANGLAAGVLTYSFFV